MSAEQKKAILQKRQRSERYERRKAEVEKLEYVRLNPCRILKVAEGTLCSIFAFLEVVEHWNLAKTCKKMEKISRWHQASPVQVDLKIMVSEPILPLLGDVKDKIFARLMAFRPFRMNVTNWYFKTEWSRSEIAEITSLRELTLQCHPSETVESIDIEWISSFTRLTKLIVPGPSLLANTPLPVSLTHLEFPKTNLGGFGRFNSTQLLLSTHLQALQVLKLPNIYFGLEMLRVGLVAPLLRELTLGYFNVMTGTHVNFLDLQSCKHLEALTVGTDYTEGIIHWETLQSLPSLRKLTISIYQQMDNPPTLFAGLSQVHQLTHLQLVPHPSKSEVNISAPLYRLINPTPQPIVAAEPTNNLSTSTNVEPLNVLPNLTSLFIFNGLYAPGLDYLSKLSTLQELMVPNDGICTAKLPRLHTLHVAKKQVNMLEWYQDQLVTVVYKDEQECFDGRTKSALLRQLLKMPKLTTLKLHSSCIAPPNNTSTNSSDTLTYFRQHLPATVTTEIDYSME